MTETPSNQQTDLNPDSLAPLHSRFRAFCNLLIANGETPLRVFEAAHTVAVAGKCQEEGLREVSRQMLLTASFIAQQAEENERQSSPGGHKH